KVVIRSAVVRRTAGPSCLANRDRRATLGRPSRRWPARASLLPCSEACSARSTTASSAVRFTVWVIDSPGYGGVRRSLVGGFRMRERQFVSRVPRHTDGDQRIAQQPTANSCCCKSRCGLVEAQPGRRVLAISRRAILGRLYRSDDDDYLALDGSACEMGVQLIQRAAQRLFEELAQLSADAGLPLSPTRFA